MRPVSSRTSRATAWARGSRGPGAAPARAGVARRRARRDPAPGVAPRALAGGPAALDEQHAARVVEHDGADADDRGHARFSRPERRFAGARFAGLPARAGLPLRGARSAVPISDALGHTGASVHWSQLGCLAWHTRRPCQITR